MTSTTYQIITTESGYCQVNHDRRGYCDRFYGRNCKADAIRYIKRVGGKDATFSFTTMAQATNGAAR